jgi:hypothetical protein
MFPTFEKALPTFENELMYHNDDDDNYDYHHHSHLFMCS